LAVQHGLKLCLRRWSEKGQKAAQTVFSDVPFSVDETALNRSM
jgi:hypothetical protein